MKHHRVRQTRHVRKLVAHVEVIGHDEQRVAVRRVQVGAGVEVRIGRCERSDDAVEEQLATVEGRARGVVGIHLYFSVVEAGEGVVVACLAALDPVPVPSY